MLKAKPRKERVFLIRSFIAEMSDGICHKTTDDTWKKGTSTMFALVRKKSAIKKSPYGDSAKTWDLLSKEEVGDTATDKGGGKGHA